MPFKPYWLHRLPEIIDKVRSLSAATIDRPMFESIFQLRRRRAIELMHLLGSRRGRCGFVLDRSALLEKLEGFGTVAQYRWGQHAGSSCLLGRTEARVNGSNGDHQGYSRLVIEFASDGELVEKLLSVLRTVSNGEQGQINLPEERAPRKRQYSQFQQAIRAFREQSFREAQAFFAQACAGPDEKIRTNAEEYLRICNRRLEPAFEPKSFEEHYIYGVALLNARELAEARKHFESALHLNPRADYVYYVLAACQALSRDMAGVHTNLSRAIELQPRNRMAARYDPDFEEALKDPLVALLVSTSGHSAR